MFFPAAYFQDLTAPGWEDSAGVSIAEAIWPSSPLFLWQIDWLETAKPNGTIVQGPDSPATHSLLVTDERACEHT